MVGCKSIASHLLLCLYFITQLRYFRVAERYSLSIQMTNHEMSADVWGSGTPVHNSTDKIFQRNGFKDHTRTSERQSVYRHPSGAHASVNNKGEWMVTTAPRDVSHGGAYGMAAYTSKETQTSSGKGPAALEQHFRNSSYR